MSWARRGTCVALVAIMVACASCGSFGANDGASPDAGPSVDAAVDASDAAPACAPEPCGDGGASCTVHDFSSGCGPSFAFTGDTSDSDVVGACGAGKARVAAKNTLDVTAELDDQTPGDYQAIHVAARLAVTTWDGGRALTVELDGVVIAELDVVMAASRKPRFNLCNAGNCAGAGFEANVGEEHLFAFDITTSSVTATVDCTPLGMRPAQIVMKPMANLLVKFGKTDAAPIDGTIDDIAIAYR
jgi:hypothetical protein